MISMRRRMLLTLFTGFLIGGVGGTVGLYFDSIDELNEIFDDRLRAIGDNLKPETLDKDVPMEAPEEDDDIIIQLWSRDGQLLFHSSVDERAPAPTSAGFTAASSATGNHWSSYVRQTADGGFLQVAQELSARREMAAKSALRLLMPLLAMLPFLTVFTAWAVNKQLRPLSVLANQLNTRIASTPSVVVPDAPVELVPVVTALNELLSRLSDASRRQKAFLADAAHELRTPLAVVSLQAQRARQAVSESERDEALEALRNGVERATRMVTQLLALARSDSDTAESRDLVSLDLEALLKQVIADLYPLATQKHLDLGLVESCPCVINGDPETLRSLMVNLIDNAIRFTPVGGRIDIFLRAQERAAVLSVSDTGPGIAPEQRRCVFDRFDRGGNADVDGTGLGLAIVRQVVERHAGNIILEDGEGGLGLTVRVHLPLAS